LWGAAREEWHRETVCPYPADLHLYPADQQPSGSSADAKKMLLDMKKAEMGQGVIGPRRLFGSATLGRMVYGEDTTSSR